MSVDLTKRNYICGGCGKDLSAEEYHLCLKCQSESQKNVKEIGQLQAIFGGFKPEYISMYFAKRLEKLTKALIGLTIVLGIITVVQIILLFR